VVSRGRASPLRSWLGVTVRNGKYSLTEYPPFRVRTPNSLPRFSVPLLLRPHATGILGIDLSWLNANYQRAMFHYVRKCTADRLRELTGPRRLATLTCFLRQSYRDTIDQTVDMFDKIIVRMQADTARELDEQMCQQRKTIKVALSSLRHANRGRQRYTVH
jgi:hypothetical protein